MSLNFHNDYIDKLNLYYTDNNGMTEDKLKAMIPLGLPDFETQTNYLIQKGSTIDPTYTLSKAQSIFIKCINNRHRYSEYSYDKCMINNLIKLYGNKYMGYISNIPWPSILHKGLFNKEICIFNTSDIKLINITTVTTGGGMTSQSTADMYDANGNWFDSWNRFDSNLIDMDEIYADIKKEQDVIHQDDMQKNQKNTEFQKKNSISLFDTSTLRKTRKRKH